MLRSEKHFKHFYKAAFSQIIYTKEEYTITRFLSCFFIIIKVDKHCKRLKSCVFLAYQCKTIELHHYSNLLNFEPKQYRAYIATS